MPRFSKIYVFLILGMLWAGEARPQVAPRLSASNLQHEWAEILASNLVQTKKKVTLVNYAELKNSPQQLKRYIETLQNLKPEILSGWKDVDELAFWINAYNALTIKLVVDHYPLKNVKETGTKLLTPGKLKFFSLLGHEMYLDAILNNKIRKKFKDARIHFALCTATKDSPPLSKATYDKAHLEAQLQLATLEFMRNPNRNFYEPKSKTLWLSRIFDWYKDDFGKTPEKVKAFAAPFMSDDLIMQKQIREAVELRYLDYNYSLNDLH